MPRGGSEERGEDPHWEQSRGRARDEAGRRGRKELELTGLKRGQTRSDDRMKMTSQLCGEQVRETSEEGLEVTWGEIR